MKYTDHYSMNVPQSQPLPGKAMVENSAGGYGFAIDDWQRLDRFLVLGTEGGSYYAGEKKLTVENAEAVLRCIEADGLRAVKRIAEISVRGRAPSNREAIFALGMALKLATKPETRSAAAGHVTKVCRTGSHLLELAGHIRAFGGWGRGTRTAFANWYVDRTPEQLAYQCTKYKQRGGFTHRDLLRLSHPKPNSEHQGFAFRAIAKDDLGGLGEFSKYAHGAAVLQAGGDAVVPDIVREYNLTREVVPSEHMKKPEVWEALLEGMPLGAMIRNLGNLSKAGLLVPGSDATRTVLDRLGDRERITKARIHPFGVLLALSTYAAGQGFRGKGTWNPIGPVTDALDGAFSMAFGNVEPSNKTTMVCLDVSASMYVPIRNSNLQARAASVAMAVITVASERGGAVGTFGFTGKLVPLDISPRRRLDDLCTSVSRLPFGRTDCAQPMLAAMEMGQLDYEHFVVYTDSETWCGGIHPTQALKEYRQKSGKAAKLTVVAMTSNGFSIADPSDAGMLDVVGFDSATPNIISEFARG